MRHLVGVTGPLYESGGKDMGVVSAIIEMVTTAANSAQGLGGVVLDATASGSSLGAGAAPGAAAAAAGGAGAAGSGSGGAPTDGDGKAAPGAAGSGSGSPPTDGDSALQDVWDFFKTASEQPLSEAAKQASKRKMNWPKFPGPGPVVGVGIDLLGAGPTFGRTIDSIAKRDEFQRTTIDRPSDPLASRTEGYQKASEAKMAELERLRELERQKQEEPE